MGKTGMTKNGAAKESGLDTSRGKASGFSRWERLAFGSNGARLADYLSKQIDLAPSKEVEVNMQEVEKDLNLTPRQRQLAINKLVESGVLSARNHGKGVPTSYLFHPDTYFKLLMLNSDSDTSQLFYLFNRL